MSSVPPNRPEYRSQTDAQPNLPTDAELWVALRAGQTKALGDLYDRHAGLVYGVSLKVLGNAQEAEDLTQDIFVKLAEQMSYDPTRGSLRTFLMILTRSRAIDRLRSRQSDQKSKQRWQANYASPAAETSIPDAANDERSDQVKAAMAQLSVQQQQVLQLAYYEGLTQAAIAERLSEPLGTVKARARRGLLKLKEILKDYQPDYQPNHQEQRDE
jgi:RNA polymerase sigma-70 factor, ECF subfamily